MGSYITIEGVEGVGKSFYLDRIKNAKIKVVKDDDVSGRALAVLEALRNEDLFFRSSNPMVEFLGFSLVDTMMFEEMVRPLLKKGVTVIQDRGSDTTCLYAALQLGKNEKDVLKIFKELFVMRTKLGPVSEKVLLLVDDVNKSIARGEKRNGKKYSKDQVEFLKKVDAGFRLIAKAFPKRFVIIDVQKEQDVVKAINSLIQTK